MGLRVNRGEQPEFAPCGQSPQARAELGPAQVRDKRPHLPHSGSQGDLPDYTSAERLLGGQKWSDVSLLIGLFAGIHLG